MLSAIVLLNTERDKTNKVAETLADLDGDGIADRPYRLSSVFDHLRGNLTAADLFAQGMGAAALGVAEDAFPVLQQVNAVDRAPLAHPPALAGVPRPRPARSSPGSRPRRRSTCRHPGRTGRR